MKIKFFGVRGSIPSPGPDTVKYGGNTSCVLIETPDDKKIIIDGGTGLRLAGNYLLKNGFAPNEKKLAQGVSYIFFSHTHWDHIQGFPFFVPAYIPGNIFHLYGDTKVDLTLEHTLEKQQMYPNFPKLLKEMSSTMDFTELVDYGKQIIGDNEITTRKMVSHPDGIIFFRIQNQDGVFVYASDTEHYANVDRALLDHAKNADILVYDAQYTPEEYPYKQGWGHSTYKEGAKISEAANVKQLVLFHHDPSRTDAQLDEIIVKAKEFFPNTVAAYEGLELVI